MKVVQNLYTQSGWSSSLQTNSNAQLVLAFGNKNSLVNKTIFNDLTTAFPAADIIGCSTAGEIFNDQIFDDSLSITAIEFRSTQTCVISGRLENQDIHTLCTQLVNDLPKEHLKYVLVLSDGQVINGSELASALSELLPDVIVTGGLAGDGTSFKETYTRCNDNVYNHQVVLCGFYGDVIRINHGCHGGWLPFGPKRLVTESDGNVLYTLDNKPALDIYKAYLGKYADGLPSSALLFPLTVVNQEVTRTILNVDEYDRSMTFAGDVPKGSHVQLMRANTARLVEGARKAATDAQPKTLSKDSDRIALLISCVGRRLAMKTRTEEEIEIVRDILGDHWNVSGFYSYGELSPKSEEELCHLHNQTMTITTFYEHYE
jgi:hypothetical protein